MRKRKQSGATVVEAALTLLLLMMFLDAILEFGRAYNIYQAVTNAAREGARYAVAPQRGTDTPPSDAQVQGVVRDFLASAGIQAPNDCGSTASVCVSHPTETVNNVQLSYTSVTVTAPYSFAAPQLLGLNASPLNISSTASMRNETN